MDEVNKIRKAVLSKGESRNFVAKKFNRSWDTINRIVSIPREDLKLRGQRQKRGGKVVTAELRSRIEFELSQERRLGVRKKQMWKARTLFNKLKEEGLYQGSERRFQEIFREIRLSLDTQSVKSYLPLDFDLGEALQIDHGEADIILGGHRITVYMFVATVPGHQFRFAQSYPLKSQEAWGDFHNEAFDFFGGVFPKCIYDNDSVLIKEVLGHDRKQTDFSLALQEHFDFEAIFCNAAAGWEKGSVENAVGYMRRNYLAGLPEFGSFADLNHHLKTCSVKDLEKSLHYEKWSRLVEVLGPNPEKKDWEKTDSLYVNSYQLVTYDKHEYSVPERFVGQYLEARVSILAFKLFCQGEFVASHRRCFLNNEHSLTLDHYLDPLLNKPSGLAHCRAVKTHSFSTEAQQLWCRLKNKYDSRNANREFIKALLLGRKSTTDQWQIAVGLAISYGSIESDAIANILHQVQNPTPIATTEWLSQRMPHLSSYGIKFDMSAYADLSREACHAY